VTVSLPVVALRAPQLASALLGRRLARVAFGIVLSLSPVIVLAGWLARGRRDDDGAGLASVLTTPPLIALVWISAFAMAVVVGRIGRSRAALAVADIDAFATASYVVPAVGVALAGPLSLHAVVGLPLWALGVLTGDPSLVGSFDFWVGLSLWGTVHVHVAFAVAMLLAARKVAAGDVGARVTLWPSVLLSAFPGLFMIFPPFLVLGTGAVVSKAFLAAARAWRHGDLEASLT
jgi:hypothetical protein